MTTITVTELKQRLEKNPNLKIIDVRSQEEFDGIAIPGAINIPTGQVLQHRSEFVSTEPVYIICQSGTRSRLVTLTLHAQGLKNLVNVAGGMNAWMKLA